ncbi:MULTISPECIES: MerR family transcriptional regulator [Streptacidiphilus]|uniref:MerR family transcriptional regulator n=1 Tax=Streptacidiphilus cavernicola TaxID=3342716 RepID=A0ABV6UI11_9ACTN|nr:MerR family transcriptional regulator [Streptacidiphilus jeojiense]
MFTIGDFAGHGRVSIRMLRHYDAIGLLRPARVDRSSGYRFYEAAQLSRLNRIVALKDLGFTLQQVQTILDEDVSAQELRGMLRLRRAELEAAVAEAASNLVQVEARLRSIENEGAMPEEDVVIKRLPALRLAELSGTAASFDPTAIGPVVNRLFDELCAQTEAAGVTPVGPSTVYYETSEALGAEVVVHAGLPVAAGVTGGPGFQVVTLPAVEQAATIVHRGSMDRVLATSQLLARWAEAHGYRFRQHAREITLNYSEDPDEWVAELQAPVVGA